ncbi:MAG: type II toxin-antitoxin system RelE/ParE family toxin [Chitinophagaceae bacterium]|nr:type II toxin-antitoxin system RelE/ParE family toxin [Chitinophagaceae bacterium]
MVTIWSKSAEKHLQKVYEFIKEDSPQNAIKVRNEIIDFSIKLAENPEVHPPDKYKQNNDGSCRAFEIFHYRISYRILENEIRIVRFRHTSRSPKTY